MNIDQYIASGILESYVLGQLDERQEAEVRLMSEQYPEVRKELNEIELALEKYALRHAVSPPPELEHALSNRLFAGGESQIPAPQFSGPGEIPVKPLIPDYNQADLPDEPIISPMHRRQGWLIATSMAASILLVVSVVMNFTFHTRWKAAEGKIAQLENEKSVLAEQTEIQRTSLHATQEQLMAMMDPHLKLVPLKGTEMSPTSQAVVSWNTKTARVMIRPVSLPEPPAGMQYQLWAIVDGKPVDAGVFDLKPDTLQGMKTIDGTAQAFAVTLEKSGGVPSPTMEQMYLIAKLD